MTDRIQRNIIRQQKARLRATNGRPTICYIAPIIISGPAMAQWFGVVDAAQQHDVNLFCFFGESLCIPSSSFTAQANILYELINPANVDGIVSWISTIGAYVNTDTIRAFYECYRPLPVVSIGRKLEGLPTLLMESYEGMREAVEHLIDVHGYRRIAFIRGPEYHIYAQQRLQAYTDTLEARGIPLDSTLITPPIQWSPSKEPGMQAMQILLDERRLRPQVDFEAVVAANDHLLLGALEILESRGSRVPEEVAVVGFDDTMEGRTSTSPFTTVAAPFYETGYKAVEMVLTLIEGQPVPETTILPSKLVLRQSCGCLDPTILQAGMDEVEGATQPFEMVFESKREEIVKAMRSALEPISQKLLPDWAERLLEEFVAAVLKKRSSSVFLQLFNDILRQVITLEDDVAAWQNMISAMHCHLLPCFSHSDSSLLRRAETLWQQVRVMLWEIMRRVQARRELRAGQRAETLRQISQALITTFDMEGLMEVLAEELPHLEIPGCYLAIYENPQPYEYPQAAPEWSRLLLAYNDQERIGLPPGGQRFLSHQLLPEGVLPQQRRSCLVVMPLYFRENQIGFVLFEIGPLDGNVYHLLRGEISSALQGALLVRRVQERSAEIARQKYVLDTFMENVPDLIYFKDLDSRITHANKAYALEFGLSHPAEKIGKTDFDFFPEEQARLKYEQEQEIIRTGHPIIGLEEPYKNGWMLTTKMPLRDEHGEIIGTFGISRDITELKWTEKTLRRLEKAVETTEVGITITDIDGHIVYTNPADASMHGYRVEELIGQPANIFAPSECQVGKTIPGNEVQDVPYWKRERINMRKDGSMFPVTLISTLIQDDQGHPLGKVVICEDITERRQAEEALLAAHRQVKEKNIQLQELNASKDKFFSIISHDLRSPFNILLGYSQLLDEHFDRYSHDEIKMHIWKLRTCAEHLFALLENLLTWSCLQRGRMDYAPDIINMHNITEENIALFLSKADHKQIMLRNSVKPEISAYADNNMVNTILRNLISNALKFTSSGGLIEVSAQQNERHVEVAVSDTGIGISPEDLPQLFRVDAHYTNVGTAGEQGTGLGLSLCKDLVEKNGGTIWTESTPGKGTLFRFTLPGHSGA